MGIINLQGVTKIYQTKEVETVALENVNLEVKAGEFLSVMGPSGCGKSTMLNLIGLLDDSPIEPICPHALCLGEFCRLSRIA